VIEHGKVEAVSTFYIYQLLSRGITHAGPLYLDHICAHPR
jgi:hypothetical protein